MIVSGATVSKTSVSETPFTERGGDRSTPLTALTESDRAEALRRYRLLQDGIHFQSLRYLDTTLAAFVGESVLIRYDPHDLAELRVYHQERFLCRALCPELAHQTISLPRHRLRRHHYQRP